jgi:hypothetical protein
MLKKAWISGNISFSQTAKPSAAVSGILSRNSASGCDVLSGNEGKKFSREAS